MELARTLKTFHEYLNVFSFVHYAYHICLVLNSRNLKREKNVNTSQQHLRLTNLFGKAPRFYLARI